MTLNIRKALYISPLILIISVFAILAIVSERQQKQLVGSQAASTSGSKLGIFVHSGSPDAILSAGPKVVKFLVGNPNDILSFVNVAKTYKEKYPDGKVLIRFWDNWQSAPKYDPAVEPADDSAQEVFDFYSGALKKLRDSGNMKYFDYVAGPPNETERTPFWTKPTAGNDNNGWQSRFWWKLASLNSQAGIRTCVGNILTGDLPLDSGSINTIKVVLIPKMQETGSVFCYHGYSDNGFSKDPGVQAEHPLAYRNFYKSLGSGAPQMIIGELGIAGGWKNAGSASQYEDWLTWYDSEIKKDSQIIGATIYEFGGSGKDKIDGEVAAWLASYLGSSGGDTTPPPPPPPPPPPGGGSQACFNSCYTKTGNGSGCRYLCDNNLENCFNTCLGKGTAAKTCLTQCISPTTPPPPAPSPSPSPTPPPSSNIYCQGNLNAPAKCFSCRKDLPTDEVNILDFGCFAKHYGAKVGAL